MKISVVIPTYNRCPLLRRTLPTVLEQDFPAEHYEVIVVVDGSQDETTTWLRSLAPRCALQILEQSNRGKKAALNAGVEAARGHWILFLDDDLVCDSKLLSEHARAHADHDPAVVVGPLLVDPHAPPTLVTEWMRLNLDAYFEPLTPESNLQGPENACVGPNTSLPRSLLSPGPVYHDLLFPRRLEDIELGLRLQKQGVRFLYQPQAVTYHPPHKRLGEILREAKLDGASLFQLCRKYPGYRAYTPLAQLGGEPAWKRWARQVATRWPVVTTLLLQPVVRAAQSMSWIPPVRRRGARLVEGARRMAMLQGALGEAGAWKTLQAEYAIQLPVLLYHNVGSPQPGTHPALTIAPEEFEGQVRWLKQQGYVGIRPSDWLSWRHKGTPLPEKPVLLTFDDAYADLVEHAFPVLERHQFGAAVFVVTAQVGKDNAWDRALGWGPLQIMTREQIQKWAARGIEFGSHSRRHSDLRKLPAPQLQEEIAGSERDLRDILGTPPGSFAYPYGEYDDKAVEATRSSFPLAFTCEEGLNNLGQSLHHLRRTMVLPGESRAALAGRVRRGYNPLARLRARLRLRTRLRQGLAMIRGKRA